MARIQPERYFQKVKDKYGDKVEILSEFQGKERPITICYHCEKHGDTVKVLNAKNVFNSTFNPCKRCANDKRSKSEKIGHRMSKADFYNRLIEYCKAHNGTVIETEWITAKTIYHFKCDNPEHPIFKSTADSLYNGKHWCPYCSGRMDAFDSKIEKIITAKNGEKIGKYINTMTPIKVKCLTHNYVWNITPCNLQKGRWCPVCNMNISEKAVWDWFIEHNIKVIPQYVFNDLIGGCNNYYRFDFAIFSQNNELKYLLEIDDVTHRGNGIKATAIQERDKLKNEYCDTHNIKLFRIPISDYKLKTRGEIEYRNFISDKLAEIERSFILGT